MAPRTLLSRHGAGGLTLLFVLAACASPAEDGGSPAAATSPAATSPAAAPTEAPSMAAGDATVLVAESDLGQILTDADGMVIYFFANDTEGTSNCEGDCLENWPPVAMEGEPTAGEGVEAELGTISGNDGSTQLTVNGFPAYYFAGDQAPGDTNGQGVGEVWWVFGADGEPIEG